MSAMHQQIGRLVRRHATAVKVQMPNVIGETEAAIAELVRGTRHPILLEQTDLPHTLTPVPRDEVWFYTGDGERLVLGSTTETVR